MRVLVSGSSGLIGSALRTRLAERGDEVVRLVRRPARGPNERSWNPGRLELDANGIDADAVVHLAGENIGAGRWSDARMRRIRESRVGPTRLLATALASRTDRPAVLVSASAVGYYGDRGDERLTEASDPGQGFLAELCQEWEAAADPARQAGVRVVHPRSGVVLARDGGALAKMLVPFKLGVGGRVGPGTQWVSWITLDDIVSVIERALDDPDLDGPVNATAPEPVTNAELTRALGRVLGRPTVLPLPAFAARLALGPMADEALLSSARAVPERLQQRGFVFANPTIEGGLRQVLGR